MDDVKRLIAEVTASTGIRVEAGDPVFAFVVLTELVLEQVSRRLLNDVTGRLTAFETSMERLERRAGKVIAQEVTETAARMRAELQKDIDGAGLKAAHLVYQVDQAHQRPAVIRWLAVGLVSAVVLVGSGLWIGAHCF
jgi:cytochrome c-type biogenesis protein CcmH/NrfG